MSDFGFNHTKVGWGTFILSSKAIMSSMIALEATVVVHVLFTISSAVQTLLMLMRK